MAVDEPHDVLEELLEISGQYTGPKPWVQMEGKPRSNPVKLRSDSLRHVTAHSVPRNELSGRGGSALIYALRAQAVPHLPGERFSRVFRHQDGRRLMLENGATRDLLAVGAISHDSEGIEHHFILTGLGAERLERYFPSLS